MNANFQMLQSPKPIPQNLYSYLSASIGSSLAAFTAGIIPDANATITHNPTPQIIHLHGTIKLVPIERANTLPMAIPRIIPNIPPS